MNANESFGITNGDGTISYSGMSEARARKAAQRSADEHGETFWVWRAGDEGEGVAVKPRQDK